MYDYVPFCTAVSSSSYSKLELQIHGEAVTLLEQEDHFLKKVFLFSIIEEEEKIQKEANEEEIDGQRGIYISKKAIPLKEMDTFAFSFILRGVSLTKEPFWGTFLIFFSSHLFFARHGEISSSSFRTFDFLSDFVQTKVILKNETNQNQEGEGENTFLLKQLTPKFTWVAIDLKTKEMGTETPSAYFEQKLQTFSKQSPSSEMAAQMMLHGLFDQRDCIMIKSTSLNNTSVCTSSKIQSHSIEKGKLKPIFGNFVCGGLLVRLVQSFAFHFSNHQTTKFVLQTIVRNVYVKFWQDLLNQAYSTYCDSMHLRLSTYDKIEMDAQYLKELMIDEKKIIHEDVDGHQGFINEFAHLKRQEEPQTNGNDDHKDNQKSSSSNKSLLKYIKHRAGKVMSSLTSRHSSIGSVDPIQLEEQQKHQISFTCNTKSKSKSMPVDITELDRCHSIALADAKSIVSSFLKLKTPTTMDTTSAGTNELNVLPLLQKWTIDVDLNDGKKKLMKKIKTKQKEFEIANATASAFFCSEVLKYLHSVLLQKIENELGSTNNTNQMTSNKSDSFSKIPLELLLYKNNIEEMISQYNFIAKGPFAKKILVSFLQTPVRLHVLSLVTKESNQFQEQIALQKLQMNQSKDQLNQAQETLTKYNLQKEILLQEEAYQISQIEQAHQEKAEKLHNAILHTNEKIQKTLKEQQVLYEKTINATKTTIHTFNQVIAKKNRFFMGYLEQFEACFFKNKWQQKFFVLDGPMLKCFKAKSIYEERGLPCEPSICLTGYTILPSTTDDAKIKVISSKITAHGQKLLVLRFRVPISVERETWIRKLKEATQMTK